MLLPVLGLEWRYRRSGRQGRREGKMPNDSQAQLPESPVPQPTGHVSRGSAERTPNSSVTPGRRSPHSCPAKAALIKAPDPSCSRPGGNSNAKHISV